MIHKDYCSRCKRSGIPLLKHSTDIKKTIQYYYCRSCNNKLRKKYQSTPNGKLAIKKANEKSSAKYPDKQKARGFVNYRIGRGELFKPGACSACGNNSRVEGHHMDYTKPLEVVWLCNGCHRNYHIL